MVMIMSKSIIHLKNVVNEDFINYKKPSMFLVTSICDWKCCNEAGISSDICQNHELVNTVTKEIDIEFLIQSYIHNEVTKAVVIGGLEPFMQFEEIYDFIKLLRFNGCNDDIVIYTGYDKSEIEDMISQLKKFKNIIIKFGRFIPNQEYHFDPILGVNLISNNQYAERIS